MSKSMYVSYILIYFFSSYLFIIPTLTIPHKLGNHKMIEFLNLTVVSYGLDIFFISLLVDIT